ncbi:hypothetical protein N0V88_006253 [Collariella sp. IMI 366227]|nr:hypothetical protein N0V88_006253 [Collariella sp. IMI 366227]
MKFTLVYMTALSALITAAPLSPPPPELPRLVLYHQTTHTNNSHPISILPLISNPRIALSHLIVAAFHVNPNGTIHLNDHPPSHPHYDTLWQETRALQSAGVKVLGIVGGAARGSFTKHTFDSTRTCTFEKAYALLHNTVTTYDLDGLDLDVEEPMSLRGIIRLVRRLRTDFGPDFLITLAPVATALVRTNTQAVERCRRGARGREGANLSGFSYFFLNHDVGQHISFYNVQFYNGFGTVSCSADSNTNTSNTFDEIVDAGWDPRKIVIGQLTSPGNGGCGFVEHEELRKAVGVMRKSTMGRPAGTVGRAQLRPEDLVRIQTLSRDARMGPTQIHKITGYSIYQVKYALKKKTPTVGKRTGRPRKKGASPGEGKEVGTRDGKDGAGAGEAEPHEGMAEVGDESREAEGTGRAIEGEATVAMELEQQRD